MDKRSLELLNLICEECKNTTYKVFEISELAEKLAKTYICDQNLIVDMLQFFVEKGYIEIKYQDETEVCLCPTQKARTIIDGKEEEIIKAQDIQTKTLQKVFFSSFLGSLLASLVAIIVNLVLK